jgi:hypothetical protein
MAEAIFLMENLPQVELVASTLQADNAAFLFSQTLDSSLLLHSSFSFFGVQIQTVDMALLILCPIFAAIGVLVACILKSRQQPQTNQYFKRLFDGIFANISNLFIGLSIGFVIALFFLGAINNDITSLAKVLVLSAFLGYKAPSLWGVKAQIKNDTAVKTGSPVKSNIHKIHLSDEGVKQDKPKQTRLKAAVKPSVKISAN